jgi:hypothetical protein
MNASKYVKNQVVDDDIFEKVKIMSGKTYEET